MNTITELARVAAEMRDEMADEMAAESAEEYAAEIAAEEAHVATQVEADRVAELECAECDATDAATVSATVRVGPDGRGYCDEHHPLTADQSRTANLVTVAMEVADDADDTYRAAYTAYKLSRVAVLDAAGVLGVARRDRTHARDTTYLAAYGSMLSAERRRATARKALHKTRADAHDATLAFGAAVAVWRSS